MTVSDIVNYRLVNQQIANTHFTKPGELVSWLGAMQAQDFAMAKWAIGLRLPGLTDVDVEKAFNDGAILRTHLLRPTWHFVTPSNIRWMLELTAPRVNAFNAFMYRKTELDNKVFKRSNNILTKTLQGKNLTRSALKQALEKNNINADGFRFIYILMRAELDKLICSGPRIGKQFTYALLDERVPPAKKLTYEEALSALTKCYFTSRGPATLQDFVTWSGLTVKDARAGIANLNNNFIHEYYNTDKYILLPNKLPTTIKPQRTFLMPDYDEYGISYKNRDAIFNSSIFKSERPKPDTIFNHMIVIDGVIAGTWQKLITKNTVLVQSQPYKSLSKAKQKELANAEKRYSKFVNGE
jgi:hypothetical protein